VILDSLSEIRRKGEVPKGLIVISLVNALDLENCTVFLRPDDDDFRVFLGLDVEIVHNGAMIGFILDLADKLIQAGVETLSLTNIETQQRVLAVWCGEKDIADISHWPVTDLEKIKQ